VLASGRVGEHAVDVEHHSRDVTMGGAPNLRSAPCPVLARCVGAPVAALGAASPGGCD
jgi:hypothetical protein